MDRYSPNLVDIAETPSANLDHVGFAVDDAEAMLRRLHADGLLLPVAGEEDSTFRYVIGRRDHRESGVRIEVLDACGNPDSFLAEFIRRHGQGAHHVTFMVADFETTVARARQAGLPVTQVDGSYPPWREAFIHPQSGIGTVVQVASSIHTFPSGGAACAALDPLSVPHRRVAANRDWWRRVLDTDGVKDTAPEPVVVEGLTMGVPDEGSARTLFGEVLGGVPGHADEPAGQRFTWPGGYIDLTPSPQPHLKLHLRDAAGRTPHRYTIGGTLLLRRERTEERQ